jgi:hypothetical protein
MGWYRIIIVQNLKLTILFMLLFLLGCKEDDNNKDFEISMKQVVFNMNILEHHVLNHPTLR